MVDRRSDPARLVGHPGHSVIVRVRDLHRVGTQQCQLARENATCIAVRETDGIGVDELRSRRATIYPEGAGAIRGAAIVEGNKYSLEIGLDVRHAGLPVTAYGRLARAAAEG